MIPDQGCLYRYAQICLKLLAARKTGHIWGVNLFSTPDIDGDKKVFCKNILFKDCVIHITLNKENTMLHF